VGLIRTVLGDIEPEQLGRTHGHEHVLFDPVKDQGEDLHRTDLTEAIAELSSFRAAGGSGLVDATVAELGRDPQGLAEVSRATGVHVVLATGHTAQEWWDGAVDLERRAVEDLAEEMVADLTEGIGDTGMKAGVIKVGTSLDEVTQAEARIIEAVASAHHATGAPITTHTTAGTMGLEQLKLLAGHDVAPDRVCIGHLDRRMVLADHRVLAKAGAYLGYDQVSKERHTPDRERAEIVARLVAAGHTDRILLGCDLARRSDLASRGGPGLAHLLTRFVPLLAEMGVSGEDIDRILIENPRRFLAWF
jgi:predicted metal-dependent phosphotriesterase family hydrolase